jgi:sugar phosphate isomerase/epimerase
VQFVLNAGSLLQALHIHDNIGTGDDHVLPYERDTIPWSRVLAALREIDCAGPLNLEIPGRPGCPMPVREARLDYAHGVAAHMVRQVIGHRCQYVA